MATEVKLPRLGQGMESGTIVRWLKDEGEPVREREPLYELDTDKVTQEVEAETDGILLRILVPTGEVEVGTTIAVIGDEGEDITSLVEATGNGAAPPEPAAAAQPAPTNAPAPAEAVSAAPPLPSATARAATPVSGAPPGRVKASPLARRIARERGIDIATVEGTGPEGRVVAGDVERAAAAPAAAAPTGAPSTAPAAAPAAPAEIEVIELTTVRKTIARRLTEAWEAPVFQLGASADATELLALREQLVARTAEGDVKPTVNDVLVKLVAASLVRHTAVNAHFTGEQILRYGSAHVGIAVAAPQGLVVPVVRDADRLTIREIARARADLVGRARDGKLTLQDLEGGTFTISNLGMYGIESFVAVLNPPQVAILAVAAAEERPVVADGQIDVAPMMSMTLTCDHRAIDGADGAEFLQTVVALVEQPALSL